MFIFLRGRAYACAGQAKEKMKDSSSSLEQMFKDRLVLKQQHSKNTITIHKNEGGDVAQPLGESLLIGRVEGSFACSCSSEAS